MTLFATPKRRSLGRLGSSATSSPDVSSHHTDIGLQSLGDNEDDDNDDYDDLTGSNRTMSSWKKIRKRVRVSHFGSVLHRNSERGDHLRKLFAKRRIKEAIMNSMSINEVKNTTRSSRDIAQSYSEGEQGYELSVNPAAMAMMEEFDEIFLEEMKVEIEKEMVQEPAIIRELNCIAKEYDEIMHGYNEFPLEVRMKNFTYIVSMKQKSSKIMTVYNASCVYPIAQHLKRFLLSESKEAKEADMKPVLQNIDLVLKAGKQYLVLGPPGSGKSTLLQAIAGLVHQKKDSKSEGTISYNGRTLEVRKW
jgi:ABC-type multidrug transport system fused ATPase/permease subunit